MKRSEINNYLKESLDFFENQKFKLPKWGYWTPEQWKNSLEFGSEIINNKLGWDITDFGSGNFKKCGLILFTIRNGNLKKDKKVYCEKIMIADIKQVTPMHFHFYKMEDIINRGGGKLVMELYNATDDDKLADSDVYVSIDGIKTKVKAGIPVVLEQGQSICLTSRVYHKFYADEENEKKKEEIINKDSLSPNQQDYIQKKMKPINFLITQKK